MPHFASVLPGRAVWGINHLLWMIAATLAEQVAADAAAGNFKRLDLCHGRASLDAALTYRDAFAGSSLLLQDRSCPSGGWR